MKRLSLLFSIIIEGFDYSKEEIARNSEIWEHAEEGIMCEGVKEKVKA